MSTLKKRIAVSLRVMEASNYLEKRDALSQDWTPFLEQIDVIPILVPNNLKNVKGFFDEIKIDGIILSGGDNIGDNDDRDKTEFEMIRYGIGNKIPILGVCRGMQILNKFFGGEIKTNGSNDHVGKPHDIILTNSNMSSVFGLNSYSVNSYHKNIILGEQLGKELETFAVAQTDKTIEAFTHKKLPIMGVMWHPEREPKKFNELILKKIFYGKDFWNN